MSKKIKKILLIVTTLVLVVMYFTNDFSLVNISKTAIIVALGIDLDEEEFEVSAQIAIPQGSESDSNKQAVINGKGGTVAAAINNLSVHTGWYPKLSFCTLVILGEETAKLDIQEIADYFIRSEKIQDAAQVAMCEGKAKDLLMSKSPLDEISSFAIDKIFLKNEEGTGDVASSSLKDFSIKYYSRSGSGHMPFIKKLPIGNEENNKGISQGTGASKTLFENSIYTSSEGGGGEGTEKGEFVFAATETCLFKNGMLVEKLTPKETLVFNFAANTKVNSVLEVKGVEKADGGTDNYLLTVSGKSRSVRLIIKDNVPVMKVEIKLSAKIDDQKRAGGIMELTTSDQLPKELIEKTENDIREHLEGIFAKIKSSKADVFGLLEDFYGHCPARYSEFKDNFFDVLELQADIAVSGMKKPKV